MDERPRNETCHAVAPPALLAEVRPAFPRLPRLSEPTALVRPPTGTFWYVLERRGLIRRFEDQERANAVPLVLDMSAQVDPNGDAGLVAGAFHPTFALNGQLFVSYTSPGGTVVRSHISRLTSVDAGASFDLGNKKVLLDLDQEDPGHIHLNGDLQFGRDGYLYAGFGDGGPQWDWRDNAQNPDDLRGKILRFDIDRGEPYRAPEGNPFANGGGRTEIFALGLRNPWRFSFDRETGALWVGDVGLGGVEEIDVVVAGANLGWPAKEGRDCTIRPGCDRPDLIDPVAQYKHDGRGASVTGGYVYHGHAIPSLKGRYVFADYTRGTIFALKPDQTPEIIAETGRRLVSFAEEASGELLLIDFAGGEILRLAPATPAMDAVPALLSATGCFLPGDPREPAPGLVRYEVRVPFWSDGAVKRRYLALPDGLRATVAADGALAFPVGAVLIKQFAIGERPVETRLFMKYRESQWAGYSYVWDPDGREARLSNDAEVTLRDWDGQSWAYPSRADCLGCHNGDRGLGLEVAQLDMQRTFAETGRTANQLATFRRVGLVEGEGPRMPPLPRLTGNADIGNRARAYLHINCAICHTREGPTPVELDLRFATLLSDTGLCGPPKEGDLGVAGARRLVPGAPEKSILSLRMRATGRTHMPPIGPQQIDQAGVVLIDSWISGLTQCP